MKITENKELELEFENWWKGDWSWFYFQTGWSRCCDHAGFEIRIEIVGLYACFRFYDTRHWDYDNKKWMEYHNDQEKTDSLS